MLISSYPNSGNFRIDSNKHNPNSIQPHRKPAQEANQESKSNQKKPSELSFTDLYSQTNSFKLENSYLKNQALNRYVAMENLEKMEFAKSALGFSAYA